MIFELSRTGFGSVILLPQSNELLGVKYNARIRLKLLLVTARKLSHLCLFCPFLPCLCVVHILEMIVVLLDLGKILRETTEFATRPTEVVWLCCCHHILLGDHPSVDEIAVHALPIHIAVLSTPVHLPVLELADIAVAVGQI